jgi:DNA repair exonuclease SbcCD ATPase subunit
MLEILSVKWRNFLTYGDYDSTIDGLDSLGPVLVLGKNGSGKSSITNAILWCLFGKTFNKTNPGDKVVNYFSGENCFVEIVTSDGWIIKRTRKMKGHDDLLVYDPNGSDESRSTNKAAQKFLNKKFKLDYQIFVSSTFFGQVTKSVLELSDPKRKEMIERLMGIDKVNAWAQVAKSRLKSVESQQTIVRDRIKILESDIEKYVGLIKSNRSKKEEFETNKLSKLTRLADSIKELEDWISDWESNVKDELEVEEKKIVKYEKLRQLNEKLQSELKYELRPEKKSIELALDNSKATLRDSTDWINRHKGIDFKAIRLEYDVIDKCNSDIEAIKSILVDLEIERKSIHADAVKNAKIINEWKEKSGKKCPTCEQDVGDDHISDLISPYRSKTKDLLDKVKLLDSEIESKKNEISNIESNIPTPSMSLSELEVVENTLSHHRNGIIKSEQMIDHCADELIAIDKQIEEVEAKRQKIVAALESKGNTTMADIESKRRQYTDNCDRKLRLIEERDEKKSEDNPYIEVISELAGSLRSVKDDLDKQRESLEALGDHAVHYQYLARAYTDRNKVKKILLTNLIPFLNSRIEYYLDCFEMHVQVKFKDNLGIESNMWDYDFCSGGEMKRIDLSIMFALYDLYLGIHGRQCNVMVLDEVDGRLDDEGLEGFVNIINNNFLRTDKDKQKPSTILIISHKAGMVDSFPTKMRIEKDENLFSHITEIA